jgi:hypothetical protein
MPTQELSDLAAGHGGRVIVDTFGVGLDSWREKRIAVEAAFGEYYMAPS